MADNASQSINNPLASGGHSRPPDLRPLVLSTYGAQWTFSLLAPVKFRAESAPVMSHKEFTSLKVQWLTSSMVLTQMLTSVLVLPGMVTRYLK